MDDGIVLLRHSMPCEFDQHPYGTVCKVKHLETFDIYLQVGHDENEPNWELLGNFNGTSHPEDINEKIDARLRKHIHYD